VRRASRGRRLRRKAASPRQPPPSLAARRASLGSRNAIHAQDSAVAKSAAPPDSRVELHSANTATGADSSRDQKRIAKLIERAKFGAELRPVRMDVVEPATKAFVAAVNTAFKPAEVRPGLAVFVEQLQEARKVLTCPSLKGPAHDRYTRWSVLIGLSHTSVSLRSYPRRSQPVTRFACTAGWRGIGLAALPQRLEKPSACQ